MGLGYIDVWRIVVGEFSSRGIIIFFVAIGVSEEQHLLISEIIEFKVIKFKLMSTHNFMSGEWVVGEKKSRHVDFLEGDLF